MLSPIAAAFASFLLPGLGLLLAGRAGQGIAAFLVTVAAYVMGGPVGLLVHGFVVVASYQAAARLPKAGGEAEPPPIVTSHKGVLQAPADSPAARLQAAEQALEITPAPLDREAGADPLAAWRIQRGPTTPPPSSRPPALFSVEADASGDALPDGARPAAAAPVLPEVPPVPEPSPLVGPVLTAEQVLTALDVFPAAEHPLLAARVATEGIGDDPAALLSGLEARVREGTVAQADLLRFRAALV